jgi:hypothetical protein
LDPLVAESGGGSVIAARVCPERLLLAVDSANLVSFSVFVPFFLLPEEVAEASVRSCDAEGKRCAPVKALSDGFVVESSARAMDKRFRESYIHSPADAEVMQEALDGGDDAPLTMSELFFEKGKVDFYGGWLAASDPVEFGRGLAEGKILPVPSRCTDLATVWEQFGREASKPASEHLWESSEALSKYKERYRAFAKDSFGCTLP